MVIKPQNTMPLPAKVLFWNRGRKLQAEEENKDDLAHLEVGCLCGTGG